MTTTEIINSIKGNYTFVSPYHKNKKLLPFNIIGRSYDSLYPVQVDTCEYKGWRRENRTDNYTIETVLNFIESGKMTKTKGAI